MDYHLNTELAERELLSIGRIISLWGFLEYEIFCQTLASFSDEEISQNNLPKEMNNLKFSLVLDLWKKRVIEEAKDDRKTVLEEQYKKIIHYQDSRNALAHGMWDWSKENAAEIIAIRIRKKEVKRHHFTADSLGDFASELEKINYKVRYPGGLEDYATEMAAAGGFISRRFICMVADNEEANRLFPLPTPIKSE